MSGPESDAFSAETANSDAAPTEIDSDDESMASCSAASADDDLRGFLASASSELRPRDDIFSFWTDTIGDRFAEVYSASTLDAAVTWRLNPEMSEVDDLQRQLAHCRAIIEETLRDGYVKAFKIGITHQPVQRFRNEGYGYVTRKYSELCIVATSDNPFFIAQCEIELLTTYRRHDHNGCVNIHGHPLCQNRKPGGEGAFHGRAPFCCYMAIRRLGPMDTPSPLSEPDCVRFVTIAALYL